MIKITIFVEVANITKNVLIITDFFDETKDILVRKFLYLKNTYKCRYGCATTPPP